MRVGLFILFLVMISIVNAQKITLVNKIEEKKVEVLIDGKLFTAYIFPETIKKPVLWPVVSAKGNDITRCYPLKNKERERADHPHHIGIWLNYGNINGLDFWNNSDAIPAEKKKDYGTIVHKSIERLGVVDRKGILIVKVDWVDINGNILMTEETKFVFSAQGDNRIIDRETKLTAETNILFKDDKEGMFGIRVARELELPTDKPTKMTDSHGNVTLVKEMDSSNVTGNYISSKGIEGGKVWGTRANWMKLYGTIEGEDVAIVIVDHPENVGYPTYWHARGYGLFAANPLGQKIFSDGKEELNFELKKGESTTFNYQVLLYSGNPTPEEINNLIN